MDVMFCCLMVDLLDKRHGPKCLDADIFNKILEHGREIQQLYKSLPDAAIDGGGLARVGTELLDGAESR